jgi:HAD superfamily hydrolase (TIGR01549 family)
VPLNQPIKTVIFDLDGTLRHNRPTANEKFFEYAGQFGIEATPERRRMAARWAHFYWAQSPDLFADMNTFGELNEDFWENYLNRNLLSIGCSPEEARDFTPELSVLMSDGYQPESWVPPDVPETLLALKNAGLTVGLLTNRREPVDEELETLGLRSLLEFSVVAGVVNAWKPNAEIFQHALELADSTPGESIYVGDNYYADIVGAEKSGLQPVLIDPHDVFPDAECLVIQAIGDIQDILLN